MIKTSSMLIDELSGYAAPANKLMRMTRTGQIEKITKGLYETDPRTPAHLLAGSIYGPSYLSFEYALAFHNLIPEAVRVITSATFEKGKKKRYETPFGTFTYRDVPSAAFPHGLRIMEENGRAFRIATAEKALCDKLYTLPPAANRRELQDLLFVDLRIDETALFDLDAVFVDYLAGKYHSTNVRKLATYLRRVG